MAFFDHLCFSVPSSFSFRTFRNNFPRTPASRPANLCVRRLPSACALSDHHAATVDLHLYSLRRHKLALLITDLVTRVRAELDEPFQPDLERLLAKANGLANALFPHATVTAPVSPILAAHARFDYQNDASLRADIRTMLWHIRDTLDPLSPSHYIRVCLEVARSASLHTHSQPSDGLSSTSTRSSNGTEWANSSHGPASSRILNACSGKNDDLYAGKLSPHSAQLILDIALLQELHSLRTMEREIRRALVEQHAHLVNHPSVLELSRAAAALGADHHRVRGKQRVVDAIQELQKSLRSSSSESLNTRFAVLRLQECLVRSLETDLNSRRPAGHAMLLRPRFDDIPNFECITETLMRGGQPTSSGLQWLADYGVTLVVDLRGSDRLNQWEAPSCQVDVSISMESTGSKSQGDAMPSGENSPSSVNTSLRCDSTGKGGDMTSGNGCREGYVHQPRMRVCNIPVEDFDTPSREQVDAFLALVETEQSSGGVVFVHCKAGIGRTGTMVACMRVFHGMSVDEALQRERLYTEGGGGLRQETFIRDYASAVIKSRRGG